jgi:uncharacterized protein YraI
MNKLNVTPRGPWADVRSCMSKVQGITVIVGGTAYTDFVLTESGGQVTLILAEQEQKIVEQAMGLTTPGDPVVVDPNDETPIEQPKRRGRPRNPPKLEGDDTK